MRINTKTTPASHLSCPEFEAAYSHILSNHASAQVDCLRIMQLQESIGIPELTAADAAKVKGVQFPFVVSDRVMIKVLLPMLTYRLFALDIVFIHLKHPVCLESESN